MQTIKPSTSAITSPNELVKSTIASERIDAAIHILRDKIYSNKEKAALFETLSNAVDEHKKHNVKRPVEVYLTATNLVIRDYALGLSEEKVLQVFFQYFESTKNDSNLSIGGFGIGAKAPLSYTDNFTVTSYFGGKAITFASIINGKASYVTKVFEEESEEPTGIEVNIPLNTPTDYERFRDLLSDAFLMFGNGSKPPFIIFTAPAYTKKSVEILKQEWLKLKAEHSQDFKFDTDLWSERAMPLGLSDKLYGLRFALMEGENSFEQTNVKVNKLHDRLFVLHTTRMYAELSLFKSSFFSRMKFIAYDGDNCYELPLDRALFAKYDLKLFDNYQSVYIFKFDRGELPVAPSREIIENTPTVQLWIEGVLREISEELKAKIDHLITTHYNNCYPHCYLENNLKNEHKVLFSTMMRNHAIMRNIDWGDWRYKRCEYCFDSAKRLRLASDVINVGYTSLSIAGSTKYLHEIASNVIFIEKDQDKKLPVPYAYFIEILEKYIDNLYGEGEFKKRYFSGDYDSTYLVFVDPACKTWEALTEFDSPSAQVRVYRKNVDIFDCDDILALSDYKRPQSARSDSEKTPVEREAKSLEKLIDYKSKQEIPVSEYANTYIFSPTDKRQAEMKMTEMEAYNNDYAILGVEHFACVYKVNFEHWKNLGCKVLLKTDFKQVIKDYCKSIDLKIIPYYVQSLFEYLDLNIIDDLLESGIGPINYISERTLRDIHPYNSPIRPSNDSKKPIPASLIKQFLGNPDYLPHYQRNCEKIIDDFYIMINSNKKLLESFTTAVYRRERLVKDLYLTTTLNVIEKEYNTSIRKKYEEALAVIQPIAIEYFKNTLINNEHSIYY